MDIAPQSGGGPSDLRVLELFSGLGGMRLGLQRAVVDQHLHVTKCVAYDTSPTPNAVYNLNFAANDAAHRVRPNLVEHIKPHDVDGKFDLWLMSPPCQPYTTTRGAKGDDAADTRSSGLKYVLDLLAKLADRPRFLFLENVKGFLDSDMFGVVVRHLEGLGYSCEAHLLTPLQFGLPNNRNRTYLVAELGTPRGRNVTESATTFPCPVYIGPGSAAVPLHSICRLATFEVRRHCAIAEDDTEPNAYGGLYLPLATLQKPFLAGMSVVGAHDQATCCFTRGYGQVLHMSSGSLYLDDCAAPLAVEKLDRSDMTRYGGRLRFFHSRELLRIFGFPDTYVFPRDMSMRSRYKLVGNSVNVVVVAHVLRRLLHLGEHANDVGERLLRFSDLAKQELPNMAREDENED
jgi:tRNA (cytosine38-C5)-methyltransferase